MKRNITMHLDAWHKLRQFLPNYFWITWGAITLAAGLFLAPAFRVIIAEANVLIVPKTELAHTAPTNIEQLVNYPTFRAALGAIEQSSGRVVIPGSLMGNFDWDRTVQAKLIPGSGNLLIQVTHAERSEGEYLLRLILKEVAHSASRFYDVRKDIDIRVVDGPVFRSKIGSWPALVGASVMSGLGVTILFFMTLQALEWLMAKWHAQRTGEPNPSAYHISPDVFRPSAAVPSYWSQNESWATHEPAADANVAEERATEIPESNTPAEMADIEAYEPAVSDEEVRPDAPEPVFVITPETIQVSTPIEQRPVRVATGKAPDNLPLVDDVSLSPLEGALARVVKADIDATATVQSSAAEAALAQTTATESAEPTQEEYRRRLNELLSGRI